MKINTLFVGVASGTPRRTRGVSFGQNASVNSVNP
jgi:hypothetical protein